MTFEEFEKADARALREQAKKRFDSAASEHMMGAFKGAYMLEAQFYMQELDRRESTRIGRRDFWMEVIVIALIGIEIILSIGLADWGTKQQSADVQREVTSLGKMQGVLSHLEESSKATANTMTSLQATTASMNTALQKELALFYDPYVAVHFDSRTKKMSIVNMGRTSLELYGSKLGNERPVFLPRQEVMGPQSGYEFASDPLYRQLASRVPKLSSLSLPYEMYIKTELGKKFVVYCNLLIFWKDDDIGISTQVNSITQTDWGKE